VARRDDSRSFPTLPFDELTYSVSELCTEVRELVRSGPPRWVVGEVQRCRRSRVGHLYFELVEKGVEDDVVGKLEGVIWRRDLHAIERRLREVGQEIGDGLEMRCRGDIDFYPPFGRLQLVVREVDSVFLAGQLSQRRRETIRALAAAGLLERNRALRLTQIPLTLALVTSEGSAAYHDFLSTLAESGFHFKVVHLHAAMQGRQAEREVASALVVAGRLPIECTVLIRGGGSRTDLAAFDSRNVAETIARSPVPVITGLGHEIDLAIADQVAHTATKTPTQAAEFLVQRVSAAERRLVDIGRSIQRQCGLQLVAAANTVTRVESQLRLGTYRVQSEKENLGRLRELLGRSGRHRIRFAGSALAERRARLAVRAPRVLGRRERDVESSMQRAVTVSRGKLREAALAIEGLARVCVHLSPERTLARGFSVTRDAHGKVVVAGNQVEIGERVLTQLARGGFASRVEE